MMQSPSVEYIEDIATYSPPLHNGTLNRRLVPAALEAGFEVIHGTLSPGGSAERHFHETEWQVILMLDGEGRLQLGDAPEVIVSAGAVIRIPPGVPHVFRVVGDTPAKVLVIYSPPLGADGFKSA